MCIVITAIVSFVNKTNIFSLEFIYDFLLAYVINLLVGFTVRRRRLAQELLLLVLVGEERDGQHHRQQQKQRQPEAVPENSAVGTHNPHSPSKDYAYSVGRKGRAYTLL